MKAIAAAILTALVAGSATADEDPFETRTWENNDGARFEASIERVLPKNEVVLRAAKGGKLYTIDRKSLTAADDLVIDQEIAAARKKITAGPRISALDVYRAVALGLGDQVEAALRGKKFSVKVEGFRVSTDKQTAYLELEHRLFATLRINDPKSEFFEKRDGLYARSSVRGRRYWWGYLDGRSDVDKGSSQVVTKGDNWTFGYSPDVKLEWGKVGVVEGVIFEDS